MLFRIQLGICLNKTLRHQIHPESMCLGASYTVTRARLSLYSETVICIGCVYMGQICITGYHGTSQSCASSILTDKHFRESASKREWLGAGVYFFEDRNHAIGWANIRSQKRGEEYAVVIAADIQYRRDEMFDLDIPENIALIDRCVSQELRSGRFVNGSPQFKSDDELRCFSVNFYRAMHPEIKVVAYTFDSTQRVTAGFHIKQRQLCVNDQSIISNIRSIYNWMTGRGGYYRG